MKRTIIAALFILGAGSATADEWRGPDKVKHIEASAVAGLVGSVVINEPGVWNWKAFGLGMAPGVAKELYDIKRAGGSGWSNRDIVADALGAALGVTVGQNVIVRFGHKRVSVTAAIPLN